MRLHNRLTMDMFGGSLLPEMPIPFGFLERPTGTFYRFCPAENFGCWYNAASEASYHMGYSSWN